jgi:hypothetical protein
MAFRPAAWTALAWLLTTLSATAGPSVFSSFKRSETPTEPPIPMQLVAPGQRDVVKQILEKPTLSAKSQAEVFPGKAEVYRYFLDNPDRAVVAWRRLRAKCIDIQARGNQQFSSSDDNGNEVTWQTVVREKDLRVWYAEGKVKASPVLPLVPVKVVVVIRHGEVQTPDGTPFLNQQTEIYVHTDSKTAALVTKMMGPSAQRMAEQGLGQFQFFFSGLCQYLDRHPDRLEPLVRREP